MRISMIAAVAKNKVIGKDNDLVWSLPDDMKFFMETTKGHCVITGRRNYESLPEKYRPLPNRTNIVVSRNLEYHAPNALLVPSIEAALELAKGKGENEVFIIGGGQIYQEALPLADRLYLTEIDQEFDGDAYFPEFDPNEWKEVQREHHPVDKRHKFPFDFVIYERK